MDPSKKRKIRLVVALGLAVLLGAALIWTSFSSASEARTPSEVLAASTPGKAFDMTGTVVDGSIERRGDVRRVRGPGQGGHGGGPGDLRRAWCPIRSGRGAR